jgi:hypothetical protein
MGSGGRPQAVARSYARIIDEVNKLDRSQLTTAVRSTSQGQRCKK